MRDRSASTASAIVSLGLVMACLVSSGAQAASIDCAKASNIVETPICADPKLSDLDHRLAAVYSSVRSQSVNPQQLFAEERASVADRDRCRTTACVSDANKKRLAELPSSSGPNAARVGQTTSTDDAPLTACDTVAAFPYDNQRKASGVSYGALNASMAIAQCTAAVASYPKSGRLHFQLGRALEKANRLPEAIAAYRLAADLGHGGGFNNLGELYRQGKGFPRDLVQAQQQFERGAALGYAEAQFNLANLLLRQPRTEANVERARELLIAASHAGYVDAVRPLQSLPQPSQGAIAQQLAADEARQRQQAAEIQAAQERVADETRANRALVPSHNLTEPMQGRAMQAQTSSQAEMQRIRINNDKQLEHTTATGCTATITSRIDKKYIEIIRRSTALRARTSKVSSQPPSKELAQLGGQDIPSMVRSFWMGPESSNIAITYADAYYGADYQTNLPEIYVLPSDDRVLCLLMPGTVVFLSDGITSHYSVIFDVNEEKQTVLLADPWANESFLRMGRNVIGVQARYYVDTDGTPFLEVSFADFLLALHGILHSVFSFEFFATFETIYPETIGQESYEFWKRSRLLSSDDLATLRAYGRTRVSGSERLDLLNHYVDDINVGLLSDFSEPIGSVGTRSEAERLQARSEFLSRMDRYSKLLPWPLRWQLLKRSRWSREPELRRIIADKLLGSDPGDVDILIEKSENLLLDGQIKEGAAGVAAATTQWFARLSQALPDMQKMKALEFLFSQPSGVATDLFGWRYERFSLLSILVKLKDNEVYRPDNDLKELFSSYPLGSTLLDFPYGNCSRSPRIGGTVAVS